MRAARSSGCARSSLRGRPDGELAASTRGWPDGEPLARPGMPRSERPLPPAPARRPAQLAASGPRAEGSREDYELLIEAIYEGYLLHYGTPRVALTRGPRPRPAGGRPAVRARAGAPRRARRPRGRGRAGRHDHAQRARAGRGRAGAGRRGLGGRRPRRRLGIERGPPPRQGPCARRAPQRRSRRCAQAPRASPRRAESRLDIVCARCQTSTPSTSPSTPPIG